MGNSYYGFGTPGVYSVPGGPSRLPSDPKMFESWANQNYDGGFEGWKQRQFSSAPFSSSDPNLQPGGFVPGGWKGAGGVGSKPWQDPSSWDPRQITQSPAYKQLMDIAQRGSGAPEQARADVSPAMQFFQKSLASGDPLGTQMLPTVTAERNLAALREASSAADRRIDESAGGMNAMANPAVAQFMKALSGFGRAGEYGGISRGETEGKIAERQATATFQRAVAEAMAQLTSMLGGLQLGDTSLKSNAAGGALTSESYANNIWAQLMQQLLLQQMRPGPTLSPADRGKGDLNPYASPGDFGSFTGSQATNPFQLLRDAWLADQAAGM